MIFIKKLLFFNLLLVFLSTLGAAETIFVPEKTLLFKGKKGADILSDSWEIYALVQQGFTSEVIKKERVFLKRDEGTGFFAEAYYLKISGTEGLCCFPEVRFRKSADGTIVPRVDKIDSLMFLGIFFFVAGLAAVAGFFHLKSEKKYYMLPAALLFFFWGYASWYIGFMSNAFIIPSDELFYYDVAKRLLAWDFTSMQYRYLMGFPIFISPIILLFQVQDNLEFIRIFMNFQTYILIPCLFLVLYRFFHKKMGISRIQSFSVLFLWLVLTVFYSQIIFITDLAKKYVPEAYQNSANFLLAGNNSFLAINKFTWLGRNAMSDYASVFLLVILLYGSMQKSRSLARFFVLSMGFGFLILVRINYILFAPLLAFVFYDSFSELWKNKRNYLYAALCGTAGILAVWIWQFILNKIQFGSPFIGPYSTHKFGPDSGFAWNVIPYGFKYLCHSNYIYMILGISSLFFLPDRKIRALLALWIFPMLLFFFGYPGVFNNATRFIFALYPPLLVAVVMNPVWQSVWPVRIKAVLVVFSSCLLCKSNIFFVFIQPWNLEKYGISNIDFMVIQGLVCLFCCAVIISMRKELRTDYANTISHFRFLILYTAVFFSGSVCVYIAALLVLAAFVFGMRDVFAEIRQIWKKTSSPTPLCQ